MRVVGVVDGVPAVPAAAGSRTNKTTPGRARRSRVCTSVMGLSLSSGASATSSGARTRAMAMFAVSRSPSLRSKRAGESATQPLISTTTQDPIATAPQAEAPTTATFRAPERRRWRRRWPRRRRAGCPSRRWGSWSCRCSGGRTANVEPSAREVAGVAEPAAKAVVTLVQHDHSPGATTPSMMWSQLRVLRCLLAAGLPLEEAVDVLQHRMKPERHQLIIDSLDDLLRTTLTTLRHFHSPADASSDSPVEVRIGLCPTCSWPVRGRRRC